MIKNQSLKLLLSILYCHLAGIIGSLLTVNQIDTWYANIEKPAFNPPNWLFGPVWLTLYTLMGISFFLIWRAHDKGEKGAMNWLYFFSVHLVLNASWSIVFFTAQNLGLALINILILWAMILVLIIKFAKYNKTASVLLVPYLLWVGFATILNFSIWQLN